MYIYDKTNNMTTDNTAVMSPNIVEHVFSQCILRDRHQHNNNAYDLIAHECVLRLHHITPVTIIDSVIYKTTAWNTTFQYVECTHTIKKNLVGCVS